MSNSTLTGTTIVTKTSPKKALIVEDSADVAETLQFMLKELGHDSEVARDGREALTLFKPGEYDLVITDYSMPNMNGVEMAEIIRKRAANQRILMVTAYAFTIAAYDGRPLPVDAVLRKPFKPEEFNDAIKKITPTPKAASHKPVSPDTAFRRKTRFHPPAAAKGSAEAWQVSRPVND